MLLKSWIHRIRQLIQFPSKRIARRRSHQQRIEALELRVLLTGVVTPQVSSLNVMGATDTNSTTISWAANFNQSVIGVDPTDFQLVKTGSVSDSLIQITGSGTSYTVTVSGITGSGTLGLNLVDNDSIQSLGTPLGGTGSGNGNFTGQVATVDQVFPIIQSINRAAGGTNPTNASSVSFVATFSEAVTGVDSSDFVIQSTGTAAVTSKVVSAVNASTYTVTFSGITGLGSVGLNLVDDGTIRDLAGNPLLTSTNTASFANQTPVESLGGSRMAVIGDFNGDGKPDFVVPNLGYNCVSVFLGNGDGTFQASQTYTTRTRPYSVTVGDLNGDGKLDLVVTNSSGGTAGVLLGNGDGAFGTMQTFAVGNQPRSAAIADVNGDGKPDILVANYFSDTVSVLLGNGNGTFQTQTTFGLQNNPTSIVTGDLNNDGKPDIVVANVVGNTVSVLLGNGDGTFQDQQALIAGSTPISVAIGDLNGDGKPDLAVAIYNSSALGIFLGNGDGSFLAMQTYATPTLPFGIKLADLNGDGVPDLISNYRQSNSVGVRLGQGDGTFAPANSFAAGSQPYAVSVGDLNGDGRPDMVVANLNGFPGVSGWANSILLGNSSGSFTGQSYTIAAVPTITSPTFSMVSVSSAQLGGSVTDDGTLPITGRGVVYSLSSVNSNPQIGGNGVTQLSTAGTTGAFQITANGLTEGRLYSFAAYATNSLGTTYTTPVSQFNLNLPPTVSGIETSALAYKANDPAFPPLPISNTVAITDPDSNNLTQVTVQITGGYQNDSNGQDLLSFTNQNGISGAFNAVNGTLTLSGAAYLGTYRAALRSVTFSTSGKNVSTTDRTLTIIASDDGVPVPASSQPVTRQITVTTANLPPVLSSVGNSVIPYELGTPPVPVAPACVVSDPDSINLAGATIQLTGNYQAGLDVLSAMTDGTGISQSFDTSTGTLNLTGVASLASYQAVLRSATFSATAPGTSSPPGSTTPRTLTFTLNDGLINSVQVTRFINVTPHIFPPVVGSVETLPLGYKANNPAVAISSSVTITSPVQNNLTSLTVQITSGYQNDSNGHDVLTFTNQSGITGVFDAATGTLTLSGTSYIGNYREALRTVTFSSTGTSVSNANRVLTIIATDAGLPAAGVSQPVTRTIAFNFPPLVTNIEPTRLVYAANSSPIVITNTAGVTDPDSSNLTRLTVQITSGYQNDTNGHDVLSFVNKFGITGSFDASTGTLTLTGNVYDGLYREALRTVTYSSTGTNVSAADRVLTIIATDDGSPVSAVSAPVTRTISSFNASPVIGNVESSPQAYIANSSAVIITSSATITDSDSNNLSTLTVQITSGYQNDSGGHDVLSFTNTRGITGAFDATTGKLTLSGVAYIGDYREALRSIRFSAIGSSVNLGSRILTILANDDGDPFSASSTPVTRAITVS